MSSRLARELPLDSARFNIAIPYPGTKFYEDAKKDGHSKEWQEACEKLGGIKCEQYVNSHDVVMGKLPFNNGN